MRTEPLLSVTLPGIKSLKSGKVRDIYELGDKLLIVATDRISAFDVVMSNGIPDKGKILTALSRFWFDFTEEEIENHLIASGFDEIVRIVEELRGYEDLLKGRSMLVKYAEPLPVECVVRGYLAGSGWREYREKGSICGIRLPRGLRESEKLPQPIFTPATKATTGHDINITEDQTKEMVGDEAFDQLKAKSLAIYERASAYADSKGDIIISDTKFEFGRVLGMRLS